MENPPKRRHSLFIWIIIATLAIIIAYIVYGINQQSIELEKTKQEYDKIKGDIVPD